MTTLTGASKLGAADDTYFYSIAQTAGRHALTGSDDVLRYFDAVTLQQTGSIAECHKGVECLISGHGNEYLLTAGRDCFIRSWDSRTAAKSLEIQEPKQAGISALTSVGYYIAAGTESTKEGLGDVSVHIFDTRKPTTPLRSYGESHTDTITDIAWHPTQKNILLTGSTDGLVSLFDIEQAEEEDAIQQVLNPRSAIHCAGFLTSDQAYVLSTDEQFTVYGLNKTGTAEEEALPVAEFGDLRPRLDCMYVIKLLQSSFNASPVLAYGHNEKKTLSLTSLEGAQYNFGQTIALPGAHGDEVVRDVVFVDGQTLLSCGEDGHVRAWKLPSSSSSLAMDVEETLITAKKKSRKDKKHGERFQPY